MPSPIAHLTAAAVVTSLGLRRGSDSLSGWTWVKLFPVLAFLTLLPDLPTVLGLFEGDLAAFHNRIEHSIAVGLVVSILFAFMAVRLTGGSWKLWFGLSMACYAGHVLMDYLTVGRGVMLLWPLSDQRLGSPWRLFYGLHWSEGWFSWRHLWTILTESLFALLLLAAVWTWTRRRAKPLEGPRSTES